MTTNPTKGALTAREMKAIKDMRTWGGAYYWMKNTCKKLEEKGLARLVGNTGGYQLTDKGREYAAV